MHLLLLFLAAIAMAAPPDSGASMKKLFRDPPVEYSSAPLLVWNGAVTESAIDRMLDDLNSQRVRGLFIHPRPGLITPYLTDEWFRLVRHTVDAGERRGMHVWLYDENSYPSGFAGGNVPATSPETYNQGQGLVLRRLKAGENADCVVRLSDNCFERASYPVRSWNAGFPYVDLIKPGVTEKFIETTMRGYERAIGRDFGRRVPGIFTDEPNIIAPLPKSMRWTPDLFEQFEKRWGYDLRPNLMSLFEQSGDWRKVRHNYYGLLLELFIDRWSKPWHAYTEKKKLAWTGHYWEHGWPNPQHGPDNMAMYAWHQMPGIDMLFNQFAEDVNAQFGNVRSVKELASVANQLGRRRTLSETYGGGGWSLRFEDMKRLGDWEYALGVNFLDQHLSFQTMLGVRKYDYPQSFSYHASWWPHYGALGRYFERLSLALSTGREVNSVLVLEPTTSAWSYAAVTGSEPRLQQIGDSFQGFVTALSKQHIGYDLASENILRMHGSVKGSAMAVGERNYSLFVLPPGTENLDAPTAKLLEAYLKGGGRVLSFVEPPGRVDGVECTNIHELATKYSSQWRRADAFDVSLFPAAPVETTSGEFYLMRRITEDGEILFVANPSLEKKASGRMKVEAGAFEELNAFDGRVHKHGAEFQLAPGGSLLMFATRRTSAPERLVKAGGEVKPAGPLEVRRIAPNTLKLDYCDVSFADKQMSGVYFFKASDAIFQHYGFAEGNPWHTAVQFQSKIVDRNSFPPGSGFTASFSFEVAEGVDTSSLQAVVERPSIFKVRINGTPVEPLPGVWWTDRDFAVYAIGKQVRSGHNTVTVSANPMSVFAELEPVILRGEFSLKPAAAGWQLVPAQPLQAGSWKQQGLPMYGEPVAYRRSFAVADPSGTYLVKLGHWFGTVAEVRVNGAEAGIIAWQPYELDVSKLLHKGQNDIEVRVHGSLKNVYGPHHGNIRKGFAGPHMMRSAPAVQPSGEKYDLDDFGLFDSFELVGGSGR
ncbi:MAG: glycosyl hydrolase [Bryobacteraceae bacterium]